MYPVHCYLAFVTGLSTRIGRAPLQRWSKSRGGAVGCHFSHGGLVQDYRVSI